MVLFIFKLKLNNFFTYKIKLKKFMNYYFQRSPTGYNCGYLVGCGLKKTRKRKKKRRTPTRTRNSIPRSFVLNNTNNVDLQAIREIIKETQQRPPPPEIIRETKELIKEREIIKDDYTFTKLLRDGGRGLVNLTKDLVTMVSLMLFASGMNPQKIIEMVYSQKHPFLYWLSPSAMGALIGTAFNFLTKKNRTVGSGGGVFNMGAGLFSNLRRKRVIERNKNKLFNNRHINPIKPIYLKNII